MECANGEKRSDVAVFISSSDNTVDVFSQVYKSYEKHWAKSKFVRYLGLNSYSNRFDSTEYVQVLSPVGGWRQELSFQLKSIPNETKYVVLMLDDFLLQGKVDENDLEKYIDLVVENDWDYLRLKPFELTAFADLYSKFMRSSIEVKLIEYGHPYFSSLQVAIWNKEHLLTLLSFDVNIWGFESLSLKSSSHHIVSNRSILNYRHVVEKGRWLSDAAKLFDKQGLKLEYGSRLYDGGIKSVKRYVQRLRFKILGINFFKFRLWWKGFLSK